MLAIGLLMTLGALVLLVLAVIFVSAKASRWLRPLPLDSGLVARRTLIPALALMSCVTAIESWLIWMLGSMFTRCIAIGALTLVASTVISVAVVIYATKKGAR
jgi:hypothetical protein